MSNESKYLGVRDPGALKDMTKREPRAGLTAECPACLGYGGWHLRVDAYGPNKHFDCSCSNCNGWGWVREGSLDATCVHEYQTHRNVGNCLNEWKCGKCGQIITVDSSD